VVEMIGKIIPIGNGKKKLIIDFNDARFIGNNFGINVDLCTVNNIINRVKGLYQKGIKNFNFPNPTKEQIRVDYVDDPIDIINITWPDNIGNGSFPCVALNQPHRHNIFMSFPVKNNCINAKQLLSHELGHWFLNQVIEDKIEADTNHVSRSFIDGYENYLSESAAIYCESEIAGFRRGDCQYHQYIETIIDIRKTKIKKLKYLNEIMNKCLERFDKQRK
jgi:hypothetical protein